MRRLYPTLALAAVLVAVLVAPASTAGHDFEETRRLVLSVEGEHLEVLVAYELRPGRLADGLRAQYDAADDGRIASAWERLARSRVIAPRLADDLAIELDGRRLRLRLADLAFPDSPLEGGRRGVAAVALYRADLPPIGQTSRQIVVRVGRGRATLEAQARAPRRLTSAALSSRPDDPVLGPGRLRPARSIALTLH